MWRNIMIKLKPTNLFALAVPEHAKAFVKIDDNKTLRWIDDVINIIDIGFAYEILGTVTKDIVDFDTTNLIWEAEEEINLNTLRNLLDGAKLRFENLLINPNTIKSDWNSGERQRLIDKWERREKELVEKVLILRKL